MNVYRRAVIILAAASLAWCIAMAVVIARTSLWYQGVVQVAVLVPIGVALLAIRAARRRSPVGVWGSTMLMIAFSFVTGFSIGNAYLAAAGILAVASVVAALPWFRRGEPVDSGSMRW